MSERVSRTSGADMRLEHEVELEGGCEIVARSYRLDAQRGEVRVQLVLPAGRAKQERASAVAIMQPLCRSAPDALE